MVSLYHDILCNYYEKHALTWRDTPEILGDKSQNDTHGFNFLKICPYMFIENGIYDSERDLWG